MLLTILHCTATGFFYVLLLGTMRGLISVHASFVYSLKNLSKNGLLLFQVIAMSFVTHECNNLKYHICTYLLVSFQV